MNVAATNIQKSKAGSCPHGLPYGACPVCSGSGGGGGGAVSKKSRSVGEMTWDQCYSIWQQMLKSKAVAQQNKLDSMHSQMQAQIALNSKIYNLALKLANLVENLTNFTQNNTNLPKFVAKPLNIIVKIAIPVLNTIKFALNLTQNVMNFVQQKLTDISDKLNAIFGELKNSEEKKISDRLKNAKQKFKSLFGLAEPEKLSEEEKEAERQVRTEKFFELNPENKEIEYASEHYPN